MTTFRSLASAVLAAGITLGALTACNTIEGMGKDVKSAGKTVEEAAKDKK